MKKSLQWNDLRDFLNEKAELYNRPDFIGADPISIPHQFSVKEDVEIAAFLAATIAWGNRKSIVTNANRMMAIMDMRPYDFILNHSAKDLKRTKGFVHRTFNEEDFKLFIQSLKRIYAEQGGLEGVFSSGFESGQSASFAISNFRKTFFGELQTSRTFKHVSDPESGSSAKRLNMFLRWMVRKDKKGVDFGLWESISPAYLSIPLDVHTGNIARKLGILSRTQNDQKAVAELDSVLRRLDETDPVKYDFALFGLGAIEKF